MHNVAKAIGLGALVAGSLDILSAFVTSYDGKNTLGQVVLQVLHSVAAGPFGPAMNKGGVPTALLGLAIHFAIMTVMVSVFVFAAQRFSCAARPSSPASPTAWSSMV